MSEDREYLFYRLQAINSSQWLHVQIKKTKKTKTYTCNWHNNPVRYYAYSNICIKASYVGSSLQTFAS